jgi:hypothetical protein
MGDALRAHADGFDVALERIGRLDVSRIAQDLKTGQQLDVTRRAAGHADASGLVTGENQSDTLSAHEIDCEAEVPI